jgi:hypothetical protein
MRTLVLTIAIGEKYQDMALITHPSIHGYAAKIGADFFLITKQLISQTTPHWEKFRIYDLLTEYDRILYIDTDAIIMSDCPNLFDIVPVSMIGAFNEGKFFLRKYSNYYNTGVMVISRCHQSVFMKPDSEQGDITTCFEQDTLNDRFQSSGFAMFDLSHKFNKMDFIQADGYIIHKAGNLNALAELNELASKA